MASGTRDRIVNTSGGGGGGGDVNLVSIDPSINPLPVDDNATQTLLTNLIALLTGGIPITGEVEVSNDAGNPLPVDNAVLTDVHDVGNNALQVNVVATTGGGLTNAELRATPVPVVTQEPISVDDNGGSLTVDATDFDIRDLDALTDSVTVEPGATPLDVNITGGTVAVTEPVSVDDNGSSLTVDNAELTELGTALHLTGDAVNLGTDKRIIVGTVDQPTGNYASLVSSNGQLHVRPDGWDADGAAATSNPVIVAGQDGTNTVRSILTDTSGAVAIQDNGGSLTVDAVNLDIRDLTFAADKVDASGTVLGAGSNNIGDVDVAFVETAATVSDNQSNNPGTPAAEDGGLMVFPTYPFVFDGSTWDRQRGDSANGLLVNLGTNNDVAVTSIDPGVSVGAKQFSGVIKDDSGDDVTVKVAHLDMTTATTTTIVAAVTSKKIRVFEYTVEANEPGTTTVVNFARGAGTTRVTGSPLMTLSAAYAGPHTRSVAPPYFLFETAASENLRVTNSAASDISVAIVYAEVD